MWNSELNNCSPTKLPPLHGKVMRGVTVRSIGESWETGCEHLLALTTFLNNSTAAQELNLNSLVASAVHAVVQEIVAAARQAKHVGSKQPLKYDSNIFYRIHCVCVIKVCSLQSRIKIMSPNRLLPEMQQTYSNYSSGYFQFRDTPNNSIWTIGRKLMRNLNSIQILDKHLVSPTDSPQNTKSFLYLSS